jgi:uncharacterized protein
MQYYKRAADLGDRRATQRLKGGSMHHPGGADAVIHRDGAQDAHSVGKNNKDKDCVVM